MNRMRRKGTREDWDRIVAHVGRTASAVATVLERAGFVRAEVDRDYLLVILEGDRIEAGWGDSPGVERSAHQACEELYGVDLRLQWAARKGPRVNVRLRGTA